MKTYVVASNKFWHRRAFESFQSSISGNWLYVSDQGELERVLKVTKPRYVFFLHWSWFVPYEIWSRNECVCFHMTDLPYGRGGSPLQNLILAGHDKTKVTAFRMIEEMDAGPVYAKREMSLEGRAEDIYIRAGSLCWEMIQIIIQEEPSPTPQDGCVTKFTRRKPEQSLLPIKCDVSTLYDYIRMLDAPTYPLGYIDHGDFRLEFTYAELVNEVIHAKVAIKKRGDTLV